MKHIPVLLGEIVHWLRPRAGSWFIDCTLGMSGMAGALLARTGPDGRLLGVDRDRDAIEHGREALSIYGDRARLVQADFQNVRDVALTSGFERVDGVVFDLGVSSAQLTDSARGFSFHADGPLDMRMDQHSGISAAEFIEQCSEQDLAHVLREYGEERYAKRIARAIVARPRGTIRTTGELSRVVVNALPPAARKGRLHASTRSFQALRIAVNKELDGVDGALRDAAALLKPGGRLCVIAFHSLEDRIVKRTMAAMSAPPTPLMTRLTKKPLVPDLQERRQNPRSRSAKLRVAERLEDAH